MVEYGLLEILLITIVVSVIVIFINNYLFLDPRMTAYQESIDSSVARIDSLENQRLECDSLSMGEGNTGDSFCLQQGYDMCVNSFQVLSQSLYASTDASCVGLQSRDEKLTIIGCDDNTKDHYQGVCAYFDAGGVNGQEPIQGDSKMSVTFKALCCNIV